MPELDGFQAVRQIRELPNVAIMPIIAVSANVAPRLSRDVFRRRHARLPCETRLDRTHCGRHRPLVRPDQLPSAMAMPAPGAVPIVPPSEAHNRLAEIFTAIRSASTD